MLAPVLRLHQHIDELFVSVRRLIGHEFLDHFRCGGQPDDVEAQPPSQCPPIGLRRGTQSRRFQLRQHEPVDRVLHPCLVLHGWHRRPSRCEKRPVRLILGPLLDPAAKGCFLIGCQHLLRRGRRHDFVGVSREDAPQRFALVGLAGHDDLLADGIFAPVQPIVTLPSRTVRAVTRKAGVRQDRPNVAVVFERRIGGGNTAHADHNQPAEA